MTLSTPKFTRRNESFICAHCGAEVPPASKTCRDHCPKCLHSLHVDIFPGDRQAGCNGLLVPRSYATHPKKGTVIFYECRTCGAKRNNRFLDEDAVCPDAFEALLALSGKTD